MRVDPMADTPLTLDEAPVQACRPTRTIRMNLTFDAAAYDVLRELAPTTKAFGRFLSQLILMEQARQETRAAERQRLLAGIDAGEESGIPG